MNSSSRKAPWACAAGMVLMALGVSFWIRRFYHYTPIEAVQDLRAAARVKNAPRPVERFLELTAAEKAGLLVWIDWTQQHLATNLNPPPDAFNLGISDGPAAGQTMPQLHFHIIPRYTGDVPDPRGGIRHVIPSRACYWLK